ncbi:hypothetical protein cypCar_00048216, partial [Cyprinus carpio]
PKAPSSQLTPEQLAVLLNLLQSKGVPGGSAQFAQAVGSKMNPETLQQLTQLLPPTAAESERPASLPACPQAAFAPRPRKQSGKSDGEASPPPRSDAVNQCCFAQLLQGRGHGFEGPRGRLKPGQSPALYLQRLKGDGSSSAGPWSLSRIPRPRPETPAENTRNRPPAQTTRNYRQAAEPQPDKPQENAPRPLESRTICAPSRRPDGGARVAGGLTARPAACPPFGATQTAHLGHMMPPHPPLASEAFAHSSMVFSGDQDHRFEFNHSGPPPPPVPPPSQSLPLGYAPHVNTAALRGRGLPF